MTAIEVVNKLLDSVDVDDASSYLSPRLDDWDKYPLQMRVRDLPGGTRRQGDGYSDQWEFPYKDWLFIVSTYEDGTQIWSAHYKTPVFDWSDEEEKAQGFGWSGGGNPVKLSKGYSPKFYLKKLQAMADAHPNVWKARHIPPMPKP